jgi:hypothetical protein
MLASGKPNRVRKSRALACESVITNRAERMPAVTKAL